MEDSLKLLEKKGLLSSWSDQNILSGQSISKEVREKMGEADIVVFLLSKNFIASSECMKEWEYVKELANKKLICRTPIILKDCPWQDMLGDDDIKAIPKDGTPVVAYNRQDTAWKEVYEEIQAVINKLRNTFTLKPEFQEKTEKTGFLSRGHIKLEEIFVFPPLTCYPLQSVNKKIQEEKITNETQLLEKKFSLIHGEEMSGKTALARHLFLFLAEKSDPVLYIDLEEISGKFQEKFLSNTYSRQFNGDYSLWKQQDNKTLILDNLSPAPNSINFVVSVKDFFDRIIIISSSDVFNSFFRDESRLANFCEMKMELLTHIQQEQLIRKRLMLSDLGEPITDGFIDQVEKRINSIILTNKIVPRYPFFVLSILQTYESYMPSDLSITSHGHCYYVLILAHLNKAGISKKDEDITACFNFAETLAFEIYQHAVEKHIMSSSDFDTFVIEYREKFNISKSILNRLKHHDYGLIDRDGRFKAKYIYYFFLGRFLSKKREEHKTVIDKMGEKSYVTSNYLTLLFIIHHTNDIKIIDDILIRTMCTLDTVRPAVLDSSETKRFGKILSSLSENILSSDSVELERKKEREARNIGDHQTEDNMERMVDGDPANNCYKILKNNRILGQILRNQYGSLEKKRIKVIVEIIADGGLRLINSFLKNEGEIAERARYINKKYPEFNIHEIKDCLGLLSFLWAMINIEEIVSAINHREIKENVNEVVSQKSTPAYDLIGYFSRLDSSKELTEEVRKELSILLKKHDSRFVRRVLSIRTQHYMNTHRNKAKIEQSVCSLLGLKYVPRLKPS